MEMGKFDGDGAGMGTI